MSPAELENRYKEVIAALKAFLSRKATIGQLRRLVREAEERETEKEKK